MTAEILLYAGIALITPGAVAFSLIALEKLYGRTVEMSRMQHGRPVMASQTLMQPMRVARK